MLDAHRGLNPLAKSACVYHIRDVTNRLRLR